MQVKKEQTNPTKLKLTITAAADELANIKEGVVKQLGREAKISGFRPGKAPAAIVEKQLDQTALQREFLDQAVNFLYVTAIQKENLRPAGPPNITVTKFVPFTSLEFAAELEAVGKVKLADYKKIKLARKPVEATDKDVTEVLNNLRQRGAERVEVKRVAKTGDETVIDFKGVDAKTGDAIAGADGKDYPLALGSGSFIPGFEDELIGIKPGEEKTFEITFPKDYGVKDLQSRKVKFTVKVNKIQELKQPKLDDEFAASVGPFKSLNELKNDIKKQIAAERQRETDQAYDNELLEKIAAKSEVAIPKVLVDEEIDRLEEEEKRNVVYRGQTWQEHLDAEGVTAEEHREQKRAAAELRVKAGLILGEIAEAEQVSVTPEELEVRMQLLKGQYPEPAMQAELDKPENRRDIHSRMMAEKTLDKLRSYATSK